MYVSVSTYADPELLRGCLASIREQLPDAAVAVVDGRYATWPADPDNSGDETAALADRYDATYHPDGPYPDEEAKHHHRLDLAPDGERCLFMDADERLIDIDRAALDPQGAYAIRIHQPLVYSDDRPVWYYPRSFNPEWVTDVTSTDKYHFDASAIAGGQTHRTDAITLTHRHDLRPRTYRESKLDRYEAEDRQFHLDDAQYREGDWATDPVRCPECGEQSLHRSQATTADGQAVTRVETCTAGECLARVVDRSVERYRYLPDAIATGQQEAPDRLRRELLQAGVTTIARADVRKFHPDLLGHLYATRHDDGAAGRPTTDGGVAGGERPC